MRIRTTRIGRIPFIYKAIALASIGGILFGYDMGVISDALPQMSEEFNLSNSQEEMVVSFLYIGGGIGAALGGALCDAGGRKRTILVTDVVFLLGASILAFSRSFEMILLGRITVGFGVSVSGIADVSYLHEISPPDWRGAVVSVNEACISLGFLVAFVSGYFLGEADPLHGWRWMFGLGALVAFCQFFGMLLMPESPTWLRDRGFHREADIALNIIQDNQTSKTPPPTTTTPHHHHPHQNEQMSQINQTPHDYDLSLSFRATTSTLEQIPTNEDKPVTIHNEKSFLSEIRQYYRQCILAIFIAAASQFCGHINVLNFAPELFHQMGFLQQTEAFKGIIFLGLTKFIVTCLVIWKIEFIGRRVLLLSGMTLISLSLILIAISIALLLPTNDNNDAMDDHDDAISLSTILSLIGVFGVITGYAASFGPLSWLIISEIFPPSIRGRLLGFATIIANASACIVTFTLLSSSGQKNSSSSKPFIAYAVITIGGTFFAMFAIPDTGNGKSLQVIHEDLLNMYWWRTRQGGGGHPIQQIEPCDHDDEQPRIIVELT